MVLPLTRQQWGVLTRGSPELAGQPAHPLWKVAGSSMREPVSKTADSSQGPTRSTDLCSPHIGTCTQMDREIRTRDLRYKRKSPSITKKLRLVVSPTLLGYQTSEYAKVIYRIQGLSVCCLSAVCQLFDYFFLKLFGCGSD